MINLFMPNQRLSLQVDWRKNWNLTIWRRAYIGSFDKNVLDGSISRRGFVGDWRNHFLKNFVCANIEFLLTEDMYMKICH